jgi:hypothetical protein
VLNDLLQPVRLRWCLRSGTDRGGRARLDLEDKMEAHVDDEEPVHRQQGAGARDKRDQGDDERAASQEQGVVEPAPTIRLNSSATLAKRAAAPELAMGFVGRKVTHLRPLWKGGVRVSAAVVPSAIVPNDREEDERHPDHHHVQ